MNANITIRGYRMFDHINLCVQCYTDNHFRQADVTKTWRETHFYDYPEGVRCDYCRGEIVSPNPYLKEQEPPHRVFIRKIVDALT